MKRRLRKLKVDAHAALGFGQPDPPESKATFEAPDDAVEYQGEHDDLCMQCDQGGTMAMCETCPRVVCLENQSCAQAQPVDPHNGEEKWYCKLCIEDFSRGSYVNHDDLAANLYIETLPEGSKEWEKATVVQDFGEHGTFDGTVESYDPESRLYKMKYSDGDIYEITHLQLMDLDPMKAGSAGKWRQEKFLVQTGTTRTLSEAERKVAQPRHRERNQSSPRPTRTTRRPSGSTQNQVQRKSLFTGICATSSR